MADPSTTSVIVPAFHEAEGIADVVSALVTAGPWHEIIVVDDGSRDDTGGRARAAGATVLRHPYNKGNGAAVKTGLRHATGVHVLIVDGDGQHSPSDARRLVERLGDFDLVIGARAAATQATIGRRAGNAALNGFATYLTGRRIPDLTSGFRAAKRTVLVEFLHLIPNGFSTPTTTTLACIKAGYSVEFVPIEAGRRQGSSKIKFARDGAKFFMIIVKIVTFFSPLRVFLPVSIVCFSVGALYAAWTIATQSHLTNSSVLLIVVSVVIFLMGLVSEQIAALRFEGRR
ncbi:MAG TPA: glycosyltransferase family 2 protein [Vicinamibacterales bacterium]|nr:glycosyltransferase family 2 protein [Vicinamibacterales bacterium]